MDDRPQHIHIGLTADAPSWSLVLDQIGISWSVVDFSEDLPWEYSIIVVTGPMAEERWSSIRRFMEVGGAVIIATEHYFRKFIRRRIRTHPPQETSLYRLDRPLDLFADCAIFENGQAIASFQSGAGIEVHFGIELKILTIPSARRKNFGTGRRPHPNEVVSSVSKNGLRQIVASLLERLHHRRGLPFIHRWYYPDGHRSVFTFRIDTDKGSKEEIRELYELSRTYAVPTTWFLDVKSHESWLADFVSFQGQEIGVHCYDHVVHPSTLLNKENFERAMTLLRRTGLDPKGITSPTGVWNAPYARAIRQLGFLYSSEFSYDHDNVPSFPLLHGEETGVLQVPVHPICIGSLLRAHRTDDEMEKYFISVIDRHLILREPVCLYHHPTHGHRSVIENVFRYITAAGIPMMTYSQYALWWMERHQQHVRCSMENGVVHLTYNGNPERVRLRISLPDRREAIVPAGTTIDLGTIKFETVPTTAIDVTGWQELRAFDMRHIAQNIFDWWIRVTE